VFCSTIGSLDVPVGGGAVGARVAVGVVVCINGLTCGAGTSCLIEPTGAVLEDGVVSL